MIIKPYIFLLTVILNVCLHLSANFLYVEFDKNLNNNVTLEFSIFVKTFHGIVCYGIYKDNNKFQIELRQLEFEGYLHANFNNYAVESNSMSLCGCSICTDFYITFTVQLNQSQFRVRCSQKSQILTFSNIYDSNNLFNYYPIPKSYTGTTEKTYFWMANIGPHQGRDRHIHALDNNQLHGCLEKLHVDGNPLKTQTFKAENEVREKFVSSCHNTYYEYICSMGKCKNQSVFYNISDCSMPVLYNKYCKNAEELSTYVTERHSYVRVNYEEKSVMMKLIWQQLNSKNYCLMEILTKNGSELLIQTDSLNNILLKIKNTGSKNYVKKLLCKVLPNVKKKIFIHFAFSQITFKTFDGVNIFTNVETIVHEPSSINIGFSRFNNERLCRRFIGELKFQYNFSDFKLWQQELSTDYTILIYGTLASFLVITLFFILLFIWVKKSKVTLRPMIVKIEIADGNEYDRDYSMRDDISPEPADPLGVYETVI